MLLCWLRPLPSTAMEVVVVVLDKDTEDMVDMEDTVAVDTMGEVALEGDTMGAVDSEEVALELPALRLVPTPRPRPSTREVVDLEVDSQDQLPELMPRPNRSTREVVDSEAVVCQDQLQVPVLRLSPSTRAVVDSRAVSEVASAVSQALLRTLMPRPRRFQDK